MDGKTEPFILLARKLFHDPLWTTERFSYAQAWIDLIYFAYHSDGNFKHDGKRYNLKRGQLCHSEKFLCQRWKWSRSRLRNTFRKWVKSGQITIHQPIHTSIHHSIHTSIHGRNIISICNYDQYQATPKGIDTSVDTRVDTSVEHQSIHNKNKLKEKIKRNNFKNARAEKSQKEILQTLKNQATLKKLEESYNK